MRKPWKKRRQGDKLALILFENMKSLANISDYFVIKFIFLNIISHLYHVINCKGQIIPVNNATIGCQIDGY